MPANSDDSTLHPYPHAALSHRSSRSNRSNLSNLSKGYITNSNHVISHDMEIVDLRSVQTQRHDLGQDEAQELWRSLPVDARESPRERIAAKLVDTLGRQTHSAGLEAVEQCM